MAGTFDGVLFWRFSSVQRQALAQMAGVAGVSLPSMEELGTGSIMAELYHRRL